MNFNEYIMSAPDAFSTGSVTFNWFDNFIDGFQKIITTLFAILSGIVESGEALVEGLLDISDILSDMIYALSNGQTDGYPILEAVGAYRYLVGDFIFYLTYLVIAMSLMLTIWHLVRIIYTRISKFASASKFAGGIANFRYPN